MNISLFIVMFLLFLISYLVCNRDFFSPCVIVTLVFTVCSYIGVYVGEAINYNIHQNTYSLLVLGVSSIVLANIIVKIFYMLRKKNFYRLVDRNIQYIRIYNKKMLLFLSTVIFFVSVISILRLALSLSGAGLSGLIYSYRVNALSGSERLPSIISNLIVINYALGYLGCYVCINNFFVTRKIDATILLLAIYPSLVGLLSGSRGDIIHYLIFSIVIYYYFYLISKRKKSIDARLVKRILLSFACIFIFFYLIKFVIGRQDELNFIEYVGSHLVYPLKLFDMFVNERHSLSEIWGQETFTNLISVFLRQSGQTLRYNTYASFVYVDGKSYGNVYTAFRAYYSDFGMAGVLIIPFIISTVASIININFRTHYSSYESKIDYSIFIYSYIAYGLFMMFYSNQILEYMVNPSLIKNSIVWGLSDIVFIRGKVRFAIGSKTL